MIVSLARHGVTEWNLIHRYQGQTDVPLNNQGQLQAQQLAARFESQAIDGLVASDLRRAVDTAAHVGGTQRPQKLNVQQDPRWRELHLGELEGMDAAQAQASYPEVFEKWLTAPKGLQMPAGESLQELQSRVWEAFNELEFSHREAHIVVVSHGFAILSLLCRILSIDLNAFRSLWIDPTGVSRLEFNRGRWTARYINDTGHLSAGR